MTYPAPKLPSLHRIKCLKCPENSYSLRIVDLKHLKYWERHDHDTVGESLFLTRLYFAAWSKYSQQLQKYFNWLVLNDLGCWTLKYSPSPYCEFLLSTIRIPLPSHRNWINYLCRTFYFFIGVFFGVFGLKISKRNAF